MSSLELLSSEKNIRNSIESVWLSFQCTYTDNFKWHDIFKCVCFLNIFKHERVWPIEIESMWQTMWCSQPAYLTIHHDKFWLEAYINRMTFCWSSIWKEKRGRSGWASLDLIFHMVWVHSCVHIAFATPEDESSALERESYAVSTSSWAFKIKIK